MRSPFTTAISPFAAGVVVAIAFAGNAAGLGAQEKELTWEPAPAVFPPGAKMAVERGNPMKTGEFVVRFSFPNGYQIPPHFHPTDEHITVLNGTLLAGMGDKLDMQMAKSLTEGDTLTMPAQMHHFAIARGETTVSVRSQGPFKMTYVNPADTPKKP
jgi:quercetin dioxygenase-like cupin family protein